MKQSKWTRGHDELLLLLFFLIFTFYGHVVCLWENTRVQQGAQFGRMTYPTNTERLININNHRTLLSISRTYLCARCCVFFMHIHQLVDALFKVVPTKCNLF